MRVNARNLFLLQEEEKFFYLRIGKSSDCCREKFRANYGSCSPQSNVGNYTVQVSDLRAARAKLRQREKEVRPRQEETAFWPIHTYNSRLRGNIL